MMQELLVARRYIKALQSVLSPQELEEALALFEVIASLFRDPKVKAVLLSPQVKEEQKAQLLIEAANIQNPKLVNFIRLLAQKRRIPLFPALARELSRQIALMKKEFEGCIYCDFDLTDEEMVQIAQALSKRVDGKVALRQCGGYDGIKVEVDIVGIEVDFSRNKIKKQLIENILKAI
jgi:F-type H+-transporting ATPase subunit delta